MSNSLIAFFVAVPVAVWIYPRMVNRTGGNKQSAGIVAGVAALFSFIIMLVILNLIPE